MLVSDFDLRTIDRAFLDNPYPTYCDLRENDPVHRCPDGSFFLTRYDDVLAVYRDHDRFSSDKKIDFKPNFGDSPLYEHHTTSLVFNDAPYHTRIRSLLAPAFTPRALEELRARVEAFIDARLDELADRGRFDLIADFASPLPVQLIGDMLGVPESQRGPLRGWSLAILGALEPKLSPENFAAGCRAVGDFKAFLGDLIAHRRRHPAPEGQGEILSKLIEAEWDGERLSDIELFHNCIFLLNAGHETTTNLIGNGVEAFFRFPDERDRLVADPALIKAAVEEMLRYESSNQLGNRRATTDVEVGGVAIPAGGYIHLCIGAANRDPAHFPNPDQFDITRQPNRHLAFGSGVHTCAGASLARMEGQIAIGKLMQRFPKLSPDGPPVRGGRVRFRGFLELPAAV
ncbi:MAG: cytochrome P450 [Rhodospirillaceae bacterium]|jgi:cytochrome P450|nr:cytochrome P450 [Rhodospirillaceae bacterium]MBT5664417.1 cytochrome P450 [Rhodospirillaceae bacterium]MBT5809710.1 cytochrome P450 [Rhodospirillaceae bacterium]